MRKWLLTFLISAPVYAQVFTEDISKINHFVAEEQITSFMDNPTSDGIPVEYLQAISLPSYIDPETTCEEDPADFKPLDIRYQVLAVTEDVPTDPGVQPQTTIIVAKFHEEESIISTKVKEFFISQAASATSGKGPDGKF